VRQVTSLFKEDKQCFDAGGLATGSL